MEVGEKRNSLVHGIKRSLPLIGIVVGIVFGVVGCGSLGPGRVPGDNINYNEAIAQSTREQMLLNLLRLRYLEQPQFLMVSSVLTQYTIQGDVGVAGTRGFSSAPNTITGGANLGYAERPTVTYLPISGQEFAKRLMSAIPTELFFSAAQAGWPTDLLMQIGLERIGNIENMSFGAVPAPGDFDRAKQFRKDLEKLKRFQHLIQTLAELSQEEAFEVIRERGEESATLFLVFEENVTSEIRDRVQELKRELGLEPNRNVFRITGRYTRRQADEITIQTRSLMAMMSFISRGTEIPEIHQQEGRVIPIGVVTSAGVAPPPIPFRIHSQKEKPAHAHTAVRFQDHWFYIDHADVKSKRILMLIMLLFSLRAPEVEAAAPVLTLPTGP
jgi:hypothetical protein